MTKDWKLYRNFLFPMRPVHFHSRCFLLKHTGQERENNFDWLEFELRFVLRLLSLPASLGVEVEKYASPRKIHLSAKSEIN